VIDGEAMRVTSPEQANDIDLVANAQGALASGASTTSVNRTIGPADQSNSEAAAISPTPSGGTGGISWLPWVIAAVSGAVTTGSIAWFLIGPNVSADIWAGLRADPKST
jgi:hypothetical protein